MDPEAPVVPVQITTVDGSELCLDVSVTATVDAIKRVLESKSGIPVEEQVLTRDGEILHGETPVQRLLMTTDSATLSGQGLQSEDVRKQDKRAEWAASTDSEAGQSLPLALTLVRIFPELLCAEALTRFEAKNVSSGPVLVTVGQKNESLVTQPPDNTLEAGQVWTYARPDFWEGKYFDLDLVKADGSGGRTIVSETGAGNKVFLIRATDELGHVETWDLVFSVKGYDPFVKVATVQRERA
eukprot:TRINITY_DN31325_c0_g1_i1.p2 TRINITY_DN31325_c0_g1~~TRINITY_DN31325_c0_g1_i1.p2  ORF type:complete len:241 (+),score=36.02 TRINITY_DN31325_c0_g1_i1:44-766(+)